MKPTFRSIGIFFLGLIIGIVTSITIVEKQFWFWHVTKDRNMIRLEIRKINLERQEIDDLVRSLKEYLDEADRALGIEER